MYRRVRARHYAAAHDSGLLPKEALHIHLLSNRRELNDTVGPYQKSLLYLVSRALESDHKMPILGLQKAFDSEANGQWQDRARPPRCPVGRRSGETQIQTCTCSNAQSVSTGPRGKNIKASHGCFDNDAATIDATLARILGNAPRFPVESLDY